MQFFRNDKYIIMSRFFCENNIGTSTYHIYFVFVYLGIYSFKGTGIYLQTENILKMAHCVFYHTKNPSLFMFTKWFWPKNNGGESS